MVIDKLPKDAVRIKNSTDYIDPKGNVYCIDSRYGHKKSVIRKEQHTVHGYKYCGIKYIQSDGSFKTITKRVHRLVAEAFIDHDDKNNIVMHLDNNKGNNSIDNLKWGTIQENTRQAYDDGLCTNLSGFDDSQSIPCECWDTCTNELISIYGSVSEASKDTGITKTGIFFQMRNPDAPIRKKMYFTEIGKGPIHHEIVVQFDYDTDEEIARFPNCGKASKETGISDSTIGCQVNSNKKPAYKTKSYFKRVLL